MGENGRRTDNEVFERQPIMVTLGGREFPFVEPGNRRIRDIKVLLCDAQQHFPNVECGELKDYKNAKAFKAAQEAAYIEIVTKDPRVGLRSVSAAQDFLYEVLCISGVDAIAADNDATEEEIWTAFGILTKALNDPSGAQAEPKPNRAARRAK